MHAQIRLRILRRDSDSCFLSVRKLPPGRHSWLQHFLGWRSCRRTSNHSNSHRDTPGLEREMSPVHRLRRIRGLRDLAEFPFTKIQPPEFRVRVASAPPQLLLRVIITTSDLSALRTYYPVKVLQVFPHLSCAVCEVPAAEIRHLAASDLVDSIQNDYLKVDVVHGFHLTNRNPPTMGPGAPR